MSQSDERPPLGTILPWISRSDPNYGGVQKYFADPDYIAAEGRRGEDGEVHDVVLDWAARDIGARATLYALRDVLTQGEYESGEAHILRKNAHTRDASSFFSRSSQHTIAIFGGGMVRLEGPSDFIVAEVLDDTEGKIIGFGFDNGQLEISYHAAMPVAFHDIPTQCVAVYESGRDGLSRLVIDQCIAATARQGLLADVEQTLDQFGEYIPALRR